MNNGLTSPDAIMQAGWDKLVEVLDRGHYVRYDFSTATKLLDVSKTLKEKYGTLTDLLKQSHSIDELSSRLEEFKGMAQRQQRFFCVMSRQFFPVTKLRRRDSVWTNGDTIKTNMPIHADCVKCQIRLVYFPQILQRPANDRLPVQLVNRCPL